ncbi:MAG: iron uptake porin [Cyanobacteria bacterium]|nr:iron uptake porin [Cyanobacteriota bacterium]
MSKILLNALRLSPAALGFSLLAVQGAAVAGDFNPAIDSTLTALESNSSAFDQVTSVSQLSDVQPTDWAFQALQSLVERYGCIAGYPDGTFRGNRALTRYEFAAGLNACLAKVEELIGTATGDLATKADLQTLQRLQEEFAAELAVLRGRVDALEARTSELEANQFSTTTKLTGEVIMMLAGATGDRATGADDNQIVFQHRTRLNFNTSFSGEDLLITRMQVGNSQQFNGLSGEGTLTNQVFGDTGNTFTLDTLQYQFPLGSKARVYLTANAGIWDDMANTMNPYFEDFDGGSGSLSAFAQRNPIYRIGGGAGLGVNYDFSDNLQLTVGYLAGQAASPNLGEGLFNGNYSALAQLTYDNGRFGIGATFNHAYFKEGQFAFDNAGFGQGFAGTTRANSLAKLDRVTTNSVGLQGYYQFSPRLALTGFVGYTDAEGKNSNAADAEIWYYALGLALPDLGKEGNLAGLFVGAQPYETSGDDVEIPFHVELFYKYQVNDFISITPGVIWQTNTNQDSDLDDVFVGTLRTTFLF